jgi:hypothetical protein
VTSTSCSMHAHGCSHVAEACQESLRSSMSPLMASSVYRKLRGFFLSPELRNRHTKLPLKLVLYRALNDSPPHRATLLTATADRSGLLVRSRVCTGRAARSDWLGILFCVATAQRYPSSFALRRRRLFTCCVLLIWVNLYT